MTAKDSLEAEGGRANRTRLKRFRIEVPATTSNLGPGFDTLALALNIVDTIEVSLRPQSKDVVLDEITGDLVLDPSDNLLCRAYRLWEEEFGLSLPGARFRLESRIPVARGLGSSAASILAGLAAAEIAAKQKQPRERVLGLAARLEEHAHTVAAALLGGLTTAFQEGNEVHALHVASHLGLDVVIFVPTNRPESKDARNVVPETVSVEDAVYNLSRSSYIVAAVSWGRWEQMGLAMDDRLQQPYVRRIAPSMDDVMNAAQKAGALGAWLSGDGPAIAALATPDQSQAVANAMQSQADASDWPGAVRVTNVRESGLQVRKLGRPGKLSH